MKAKTGIYLALAGRITQTLIAIRKAKRHKHAQDDCYDLTYFEG
jgi:hypothetical protein